MATTIAEDMKRLTEDMIAGSDARLKSVGSLVTRTRETLKGFCADRHRMAISQTKDLAGFMSELSKEVGELRHKAQRMIEEFDKAGRQMSKEQSDRLADYAQSLAADATGMLKRFDKERSHMSKELRERLGREIAGVKTAVEAILKDTAHAMNEQHSGMVEARKAWQNMSAAIRHARTAGTAASAPKTQRKKSAPRCAAPKSQAGKAR
jgi:uncharacterized protein YicC (UPF0701 family)